MFCLQNFTTEEILSNHKKQCLLINGCQAVNYESGTIKLINHNKQLPILFKIYADTECSLKRVNSYEGELYLLLFLKVNIVLTNLSHGY